jgi:hypothetical protein
MIGFAHVDMQPIRYVAVRAILTLLPRAVLANHCIVAFPHGCHWAVTRGKGGSFCQTIAGIELLAGRLDLGESELSIVVGISVFVFL